MTDPSPAAPRYRVLHVRIGSANPGGPERGILDLGRGMAALGEPMALAVLDDGRTRWDRLRAQYGEAPVPLFGVRMHGPFDPVGAYRLATLSRRLGARILHAHEYKSDVLTRLAAPLARLPWVSTLHGVYSGDELPRLYEVLDGWALAHARRVFSVSSDAPPGGGWRSRVETVPNVVPVPAEPLRSVVDRPRRLVAIGRLERQKGLDVLLRALPAVRTRVPDISLAVVGDGSERTSLETLSRDLGLERVVTFRGWLPRVEDALDLADLLVMPSRWESQGRVALEAMAQGLPVVATTTGTLPQLIDDPALGRLIDPLTPSTLADALVWAAGQRFDAVRAWRVVRTRHAPEVLARIYLEAYRALGVALPERAA